MINIKSFKESLLRHKVGTSIATLNQWLRELQTLRRQLIVLTRPWRRTYTARQTSGRHKLTQSQSSYNRNLRVILAGGDWWLVVRPPSAPQAQGSTAAHGAGSPCKGGVAPHGACAGQAKSGRAEVVAQSSDQFLPGGRVDGGPATPRCQLPRGGVGRGCRAEGCEGCRRRCCRRWCCRRR